MLKIYNEVGKLIRDEKKGEIIKNGIKAAIVGKPNVGKSSLLNLLSKKEKAIVTEIPGTTRDAVEEILYIEGVPLILIDTAGIRNTEDRIEKIGVEKSLKQIDDADLVIIVLDGSREFDNIDEQIENVMTPLKAQISESSEELDLELKPIRESHSEIKILLEKLQKIITDFRNLT